MFEFFYSNLTFLINFYDLFNVTFSLSSLCKIVNYHLTLNEPIMTECTLCFS
jgi:hypothetical protein